jgi:hypothetical protein
MPKFTESQKRIILAIINGETTRKNLGENVNTVRNLLAQIKAKIEGGESLGYGEYSPMTNLIGDMQGILLLHSRFLFAVIAESSENMTPAKIGLCSVCLKSLNESVQPVVNDQCFIHWLESLIGSLTNKESK